MSQPSSQSSQPNQSSAKPLYSRTNPLKACLTENRHLNGSGSEKDTRHLVVDIAGTGMTYGVGDSLGVFARNPEPVVEELLRILELDGAVVPQLPAVVGAPAGAPAGVAAPSDSLRGLLSKTYILNRVGKKFVRAVLEKLPQDSKREHLAGIIASDEALDEYVWTRDVVDVLLEYPGVRFTAEEFLGLLTKSSPRLYSIASSPLAHPSEVHLTVALVNYTTHGRRKMGLATGYLCEGAPLGEKSIPVFVQPSKHFHLPQDAQTPIIMVGPGTGIAPFRAFLQERQALGYKGRNWLFFGDQHAATDFLYGEELTAWYRRGFLTRLDTAFSRDQTHKIYVQDRMRENAKELWDWLQQGAYFYVCGDAKRMAKDVHATLIEIAREQGGMTQEAAVAYVEQTLAKEQKRYLKDVY